MRPRPMGEQELAVLTYVTEHAPITVREVADAFAESHGLARTTILTMLERLRAKGFLEREKDGSAFQYRPVQDHDLVLKNIVRRFVQSVLGGSVSPFVAYLAEESTLKQEEVDELRSIVERLDDGGKGDA